MNKQVTVIKVYPKINNNFVAKYNELGFQLSESKNKGIHFSSNENNSIEEMMVKVNHFIDFANSYGLSISFDISKVVTTSERIEGLNENELKHIMEENK